jgi:putative photosynthetic complex assembly protein 2
MTYAAPILFVLFVWWFSTGAVIYLNNLPPRTFPWTMAGATAMLIGALCGIFAVCATTTVSAVYCSFSCGLLAWAWTQLTFYTGAITGPRKQACAPECSGFRHFWHAAETCLYHELAALVVGAAVVAASFDGENHAGAWTYVILWSMHLSAKINAVLGVRNLNEEFFPVHLKYLRAFLKERPINGLFPFSVTAGTIAATLIFQQGARSDSPHQFVASVFLGTLMVLAVLEHWLLILPIPAAALWAWALSGRKKPRPAESALIITPAAASLTFTPAHPDT